MRMQFRQAFNIVTLFLLISCLFWSCGDQKEEPKAPVISKKIAVQKKAKSADVKAGTQTETSEKKADIIEAGQQEASVAKRLYDPNERLNPFIPLFGTEDKESADDKPDKSKRKKRIPQTPLERISINQLKLVAIIRASSGNRALVEDNTGKGYIIKKGTYIGLNSGKVIDIQKDNVIIKEEVEDVLGKVIVRKKEIRLPKPPGE